MEMGQDETEFVLPAERMNHHRPYSWIAILGISTVFLLALIVFVQAEKHTMSSDGAPTTRIFLEQNVLDDLSPAGDAAWKNLTSANGGFIWVKSDELNVEESKSGMEEWGISMFHALHCLQILRDTLVATTSKGHSHQRESLDDANHDKKHQHGKHAGHCLGYLADVGCVSSLFD